MAPLDSITGALSGGSRTPGVVEGYTIYILILYRV